MCQICEEKYKRCLVYTKEALDNLKMKDKNPVSKEFLRFAQDYYKDAKHYAKKGDYITALEAVAYAHGFIDAGVLAGYFEIKDYHLKEIND